MINCFNSRKSHLYRGGVRLIRGVSVQIPRKWRLYRSRVYRLLGSGEFIGRRG